MSTPVATPGADDLSVLAEAVQQTIAGEDTGDHSGVSSWLQQSDGPVYVALRANGIRTASAWANGSTMLEVTIAVV